MGRGVREGVRIGRRWPNRRGITVCRLRRVEVLAIEVEELDVIDGSPVVDVKPYMQEFGSRGKYGSRSGRASRWWDMGKRSESLTR
jgi:tRNA (Thr-GGU) A37 N-methylase